jgi:hypothetical protein
MEKSSRGDPHFGVNFLRHFGEFLDTLAYFVEKKWGKLLCAHCGELVDITLLNLNKNRFLLIPNGGSTYYINYKFNATHICKLRQ